MKSRSNHTAPSPGRRLLIVNSVILLLVNCAILVQSEDPKIELSSWIQVDQSSWPKAGPNGDKSQFLVYHSEYANSSLFGLNKKFADGADRINNPELSFTYWSVGDSSLRVRRGGQSGPVVRDYKLIREKTNNWHTTAEKSPSPENNVISDLKDITKDEWDNFAFVSQDVFTLALKNVQVKYFQRVDLDKMYENPDEITGYNSTEYLVNFKKSGPGTAPATELDVKIDGQTITVKGRTVTFPGINVKTIKFTIDSNGKHSDIELSVDPVSKKLKPVSSDQTFADFFKTSPVNGDTLTITDLKIVVLKDDFVISKITYKPATNPTTDVEDLYKLWPKPQQVPSSTAVPTYTIVKVNEEDQIKGVVHLSETAPADKDVCYTVTKTTDKVPTVDVYLTLNEAKVGIKLTSLATTDEKADICLSKYVALQNIGKYMISFVVQGTVLPTFALTVKSDNTKSPTQTTPKSPNGPITADWILYNSRFDYSITTNDDNAVFSACDGLANCYPYETKDKKVHTISKAFQKELSKFPFIRIQSSVLAGTKTATFTNGADTKAKKDFNDKFNVDNEKSITKESFDKAKTTPALKFDALFDSSNQAKFTLPIELIDLRAHQLIVKVSLVNQGDEKQFARTAGKKTTLSLVNLVYKRTENGDFTFPDDLMIPGLKIEIDQPFSISTDELFTADLNQAANGITASFTLELVTEEETAKKPKVLVSFDVRPIDWSKKTVEKFAEADAHVHFYPEPTAPAGSPAPAKENKESIPLKAKKTRLIVTDWILNAVDQKLVNTKLETTLTVTGTNNIAKPENFQVYRLVVGEGYPKLFNLGAPKPDAAKKNVITFTDNLAAEKDKDFTTNGNYRIGYFVHSAETFDSTIAVTKFAASGNVSANANSCKKEVVSAFSNCKYAVPSCLASFEFVEKSNSCELKRFNKLTVEKCNMSKGCSNIFDRQLAVSKNYKAPSGADKEYSPFQIGSTKHYLFYNRPSNIEKGDFCVKFMYSAAESPLQVSVIGRETGIVYPTTDPKAKHVDAKICVSWLTDDLDDTYGLIFSFVNAPIFNIDDHYVEFVSVDKVDSNEATIGEGIYVNNLDSSQFTIQAEDIPKVLQTWIGNDELSNLLEITVPVATLKSLPTNAQINKDTSAYINTIRTKWIRVPKKIGHLQLAYAYDSGAYSDETKIKLRVNSLTGPVWEGDASEPNVKADEVFVVPNTAAGVYQLEIEVQINQTEILKSNSDGSTDIQGDLVIKFSNFSINDPCVSQKRVLETCTNDDQGTCARTNTDTDFSFICQCKNNYNGTNCELFDYCLEDKAKPEKLRKCKKSCKNDNEFKNVECECDADETWNPFQAKCVNFKKLNCGANQYLSNKLECNCVQGFVNISNVCVDFDPCNEDHRKTYSKTVARIDNIKTCTKDNTKCEKTGNKHDSFNCVCNAGFVNQHDIPSEKCLPEDPCKTCTSNCFTTDNKVYNCVPEKCTDGFDLKDKACVFNAKRFKDILGCDGEAVLIESDKKPGCKCATGQKFDAKTRKCLPECSQEVETQCKAQKAVSCKWVANAPLCECKPNEIPYANNQSNPNKWECLSRCDILALPDQQDLRCTGSFEHCDSSAPFVYEAGHGILAKADNINNVFVVTANKLDAAQHDAACKCDLGFTRDPTSKKCGPYYVATHQISGMEFDWKQTNDDDQFLLDATAAFQKLIRAILKLPANSLEDALCIKNTATPTILCSASFQSELSDQKIGDLLDKACVYVGDDKSKCVYLPIPANSNGQHAGGRRRRQAGAANPPEPTNVLVHPKSHVSVTEVKYCEKDKICGKYQYAICSDKVKPFECLCEENLFKVIDVETRGKLRMQSCELTNLCNEAKFGCTDKVASCHYHVELTKNEYVPHSYCTCPNSNLTLSDRALSCKYTCDGACAHSKDCARDYLSSKYTCHCSDGWSGDKCDKQVESESTSKAYLISTIVVSIIAVIALIGLAVLYFRRR